MEHRPIDLAEREALAALCEELPALRHECAAQSEQQSDLLSRIEDAARARRPIRTLLNELLGTSGADAARGLSTGLPGAGPGRADEERFVCPDGACDRVAHTAPAGPIPRCQITDQPMTAR